MEKFQDLIPLGDLYESKIKIKNSEIKNKEINGPYLARSEYYCEDYNNQIMKLDPWRGALPLEQGIIPEGNQIIAYADSAHIQRFGDPNLNKSISKLNELYENKFCSDQIFQESINKLNNKLNNYVK